MPVGNESKPLRGCVSSIYSNSLDEMRFFSTLTLVGLCPWLKLPSHPLVFLVYTLGGSKMFCMEYLYFSVTGEESPRAGLRERGGSRCATSSFSYVNLTL